MSDENPATGPWQFVGALLPPDVRRRIFEPAYYDLARERLVAGAGPGGSWFALGVFRLLVGSVGHGMVMLLRDRRRAQRFLLTLGLLALMTSLVLAVLLRDWILFLASNLSA